MISLRVFLDADVLFAAAASSSPTSASRTVIEIGRNGHIECISSTQAIAEADRNIGRKRPAALATLRMLLGFAIHVVPDPERESHRRFAGQADEKDLPILIAALEHGCTHLLTFNIRHFTPLRSTIIVQRPGEFLVSLKPLDALLEPKE
jgi:predicted nucleic acid-binding protein